MNKTFFQGKTFGFLLAFISVFIWGITFVSTKVLLKNFSPFEILFYRFIIAYISLWLMKPKILRIPIKENLLYLAAGISGVVLYQLFENAALSYTSASNVSVIVSIAPLITAIIAQIFLKERHVSIFFILGFFISIAGIGLVNFSGKGNININPKGDFLALASALCWGFYSLFVSLINKKGHDIILSTRRIFFFALCFMAPLVISGTFLSETSFLHMNWTKEKAFERFTDPWVYLNLIFLGSLASGLCFATWNKACALLGTVKTSCMIYLIPIVTIVFAFFILDEEVTILKIAGTVITIVGLFVSEIKSKSKEGLFKN